MVAELDEDEFVALLEAVNARRRDESWTNVNEGLAAVCEAVWELTAVVNAGIPAVMVSQTRKVAQVEPYPRPDWLKPAKAAPKEIVVTRVADAVRLMKKGGGGSGGD